MPIGQLSRPVVVARELTKLHEEFLRGTPAEIRAALESRPAVKGEMTLLIGKASSAAPETTTIDEAVALHIQSGMSRMDAIKEVARTRGLSEREVYRQTQIEKE